MRLQSDRLWLRPVNADDGDALFNLHRDPLVNSFRSGPAPTRGESDERLRLYLGEWEHFGCGFWMVYERLANGHLRFVGRSGLRSFEPLEPQIGYCFFGAASGRGLVVEAMQLVVDTAFSDFGLESLVSLIRPTNRRSQSVTEKLGFLREGEAVVHDVRFLLYRRRNSGLGRGGRVDALPIGGVPE